MVGVLVYAKGGVWHWMCGRKALWLIEGWPLWMIGIWVMRRDDIG